MIQMAIRQASGLMLNLDDPKHQPVAAKQVALEDVGVMQTAVTVMMAAVVVENALHPHLPMYEQFHEMLM